MTLSLAKYNESLLLSHDLTFTIQSKLSMTTKDSNQEHMTVNCKLKVKDAT